MPTTVLQGSMKIPTTTWTHNELIKKQTELEKSYGKFADLYELSNTYGLTINEYNAMEQLRRIRFLLEEPSNE